jgi:hypothetical protein
MEKIKWTRFADAKPPMEATDKTPGSEIIVKYPSNVKAYGEWGRTFRSHIDPNAKWILIPEAED